MAYRSSKTFGHDLGLSACFRQWRADSHCKLLHGYALSIHLEFEADKLDARNWVVDFGSLKSFNQQLVDTFDHKLLVAIDDPKMVLFREMEIAKLCQIVVVLATGCEAFAELIYKGADVWLHDAGYAPRVRMHSVTVSEHGANSATYMENSNV